MLPTLADGDIVFVDPRRTEISSGSIVAAFHPTRPDLRIVKRVHRIDDDHRLVLRSDNSVEVHAADSRTFGPIHPNRVLGGVTSRLARRA